MILQCLFVIHFEVEDRANIDILQNHHLRVALISIESSVMFFSTTASGNLHVLPISRTSATH